MIQHFLLSCLCLFCVFSQLVAQSPMVVGIAGGTGSGKSTFAKKIKETFGENVVLIEQDAYYKNLPHLGIEERKFVNFDHPDSLDFPLLCQHLVTLKNGQSILKPTYDFKTHSRTSIEEEVNPAKIILVEGVLLFSVPEVRELLDIKIFIDVKDDIRLLRRIERDMQERGRTLEEIKNQYLATVKPMHQLFVAPSKIHADVIIPAIGDTTEAEKIITSRLNF
ncbi:MAG: uridine kinase [Parachlamydiaceae bacterium]|nr:uridine kinase [Parachlamydiaceae bacterium]